MAFTFVQHLFRQDAGPETTAVIAYPSNNTSGNLLVLYAIGSQNITGVTDTRGNTWVVPSGMGAKCAYCLSCAAGANTVTATFAAANSNVGVEILEYHPPSTPVTLDLHADALGQVSACASFSIAFTPAQANELAVVAGVAANNDNTPILTGGTGIASFVQRDGNTVFAFGDELDCGAAGAKGVNMSATLNCGCNVGNGDMYVITFKSPATGVTGTIAQRVGGLRQTATGTQTISGTVAQRLGGLRQAASGAQTITGTAAQRLGGLRQSASGGEGPVPKHNPYRIPSAIKDPFEIDAT